MKDEFLFCPLGGSGEIGMNMNLFGYGQPGNHKWIMVDIGVTFADDTIPGVDLIYPDPGFIQERKENLLGIVLTHAHEDHIGAVAHLSSPETLRSQRAKLISRVNTEHRVLNGTDLIVRQRSANDRRRSVYTIGHVDVSDPD